MKSIKIYTDTYLKIKHRAIDEDKHIQDLIKELLEKGLKAKKKP